MSGYRNFAVAGAGALGKFIVEEYLKAKEVGKVDRVVVLTRSATGTKDLAAKGAEPIVVDYSSPSSLEAALKGVDVVISTLGGFALSVQESLGAAAKAAGVKLFVPSEFGGNTDARDDGIYGLKGAQRKKLGEIGMPWATYFTGPFADWFFFQPFLGFDFKNGKAEIGGKGDSLVTFTSRRDIARYVVYTTTSLPAEKLHNRAFKIEGERTTLNKIMAEYQQRTGKKLEITYLPVEQVEEAAKNPQDFKAFLQLVFERDGTVGKEEEMNVDWKEFNPEKVVDAILSYSD